jgi:hypothetical protein
MRMIQALALSALLIVTASGCKSNPTFHVTSALDPCEKGVLTGTLKGVEYALVPPGDPTSPEYLGVACYGVLEPSDVGKDFPAEIQPGSMTLTVQGNKYAYTISAARETK